MKKLISTVLALGMAASLAACGSSAAATPASTADAVSTESAADTDLAYIQGKGKMTIGYTVYEPMNYTDADGNFTGFDTELATAVCAKLGVEPDFVEINWDTKVVELDAKSIDCIWNGMTLTDDIMANAACTKPYAKNAQVVVMKADAAVLDLTLATAMIGEGTDYTNLAIKDELNAEEYGVAFRKGSDAAEAVNAAFDELKADGTMQALADKYSLTLAD